MNAPSGSGTRPRLPRILAVDDSRANLVCLQLVLEPEGYEVVAETSGRSALKLCASTSFDLVLLDVMMPDLDGIEVATRLRAHPDTRHVPIAFVTAVPELVIGLRIGGARIDVIPKPIDLDALRATVACLVPLGRLAQLAKVMAR
jgi:two-component system sensor histidine kinase/response regulator